MDKKIELLLILSDVCEMKISEEYGMPLTEETLAQVINMLLSFSVKIDEASEEEIAEYSVKFCSMFTDNVMFAEVFRSFIMLNRINATTFSLKENLNLWNGVLKKVGNLGKQSEDYSFIYYFVDVIKTRYLYSCYYDIASHTSEIREIADELKTTKKDYDRINRIISVLG